MNLEKKIGGLYQLKSSIELSEKFGPLRFCFVYDSIVHDEDLLINRCPVEQTDLLILIKPDMYLTQMIAGGSTAVVRRMAHRAPGWGRDYDLARYQWFTNKRIPGSVFMVPDGRLIWISDIDFKYFEEVKI